MKPSQMTSKERFFSLLYGKPADRPAVINPVSAATSESVSDLGLDFSKVHIDAESTAALACYTYEKIGFDSIAPYFSVVAEGAALGAEIRWGDNQNMPAQRGAIFSEPEQVKVPDDFLNRPSTRCIIEAIKLISKRHSEDALIIGKALGPWTLSLHLFGMENTLIATIEEREKLSDMLKAFKKFTRMFTEAQLEAGAHMITIADHNTRNLVGPAVYNDFVKPLHNELNDEFPGKLILHCCGNTEDRVELFAQAGFPIYHFESANNISNIVKSAGNMKLTGCVNNPTVLLNGSKEDVIFAVKDIMRHGIDILSPECALPLRTPNRNLKAIVDCAKGLV